jgi:hypothetical protein
LCSPPPRQLSLSHAAPGTFVAHGPKVRNVGPGLVPRTRQLARGGLKLVQCTSAGSGRGITSIDREYMNRALNLARKGEVLVLGRVLLPMCIMHSAYLDRGCMCRAKHFRIRALAVCW